MSFFKKATSEEPFNQTISLNSKSFKLPEKPNLQSIPAEKTSVRRSKSTKTKKYSFSKEDLKKLKKLQE
jgi:hypothetical protein